MRNLLVASQTKAIVGLLVDCESIIKIIDNWQELIGWHNLKGLSFQNLMLTGQCGHSHFGHTALAHITTDVIVGRVYKVFTTNSGKLVGDWMQKLQKM